MANYQHVPGIAKRAKKHCISAGGQRNQLCKKRWNAGKAGRCRVRGGGRGRERGRKNKK